MKTFEVKVLVEVEAENKEEAAARVQRNLPRSNINIRVMPIGISDARELDEYGL